MPSEVQRLAGLGWEAPAKDSDGVGYVEGQVADISYPRNLLDTQVAQGGAGFWMDARALEVAASLSRARVGTIWDVGAGSGAMAKRLPAHGVNVVSVEPLPEGAKEAAKFGGDVFCGTLESLHLPADCIPAIGMFDVLEHLDDPSRVLDEAARVLAPGAFLIATVPAYPWLWSSEDEALGHHRRYTRTALASQVRLSGFSVIELRYLFSSLVLPAALTRALPYRLRVRRDGARVVQHLGRHLELPGAADKIALRVLRLEQSVGRVMALPFGLSLLVVGQKRESRLESAT